MRTKTSYNVLATICIIFGIGLLLENYGIVPGVHKAWPIFPLFVGLGLNMLFFKRKRSDSTVLGMGVFLTLFSLLAFFYNFTTWKYIIHTWPLFIGFVGVSFLAVAFFISERWIETLM